jgi:VanZ family protein
VNRTWLWLFWLWTILLFTLTSLPHLDIPVTDKIGVDKLEHLFFYGLFGFLFLKWRGLSTRALGILLVMTLIIPPLDEIHQLWIPGRNCSALDMAADVIGMCLVMSWGWVRLRRTPRSQRAD